MPTYKVTDPQSGRTLKLTGDSPPTEQELEQIFATVNKPLKQENKPSLLGSFASNIPGVGTAIATGQIAKKTFDNAGVIGETLLPAGTKVAKQIGTSLGIMSEQKGLNTSLSQAQEMNKRINEKLKTEQDPTVRELLLKTARESGSNISDIASGVIQGQQQSSGLSDTDLQRSNLNNALRGGIGMAAETASYLAPGAVGGKTATAGQRIIRSGLQGATAGGLTGVAKATQEDTLKDAVTDVAGGIGAGGVLGAGTQAGLETLPIVAKASGKVFDKASNYLKEKGYEMYAVTFKDNKTAQRIIERSGGPEALAKSFVDAKLPNTKNGVIKELRKMSGKYEQEVTNKLKTIGQTRNIDVDTVIDELIKDGQKYYKLPDPKTQRELAEYVKYLESFRGQYGGPKGNLNNLNELRKELDKSYTGVNPANVKDGEKLANDLLANKLRSIIQEKAPITQNFFKKYSLLKKAEQIFYKETMYGFNELLGALSGTAITGLSAGGALMGALGARLIKSPGLTRAVAKGISTRKPSVGLPIPQPAKEITKKATTIPPQLFQPFISKELDYVNQND